MHFLLYLLKLESGNHRYMATLGAKLQFERERVSAVSL